MTVQDKFAKRTNGEEFFCPAPSKLFPLPASRPRPNIYCVANAKILQEKEHQKKL